MVINHLEKLFVTSDASTIVGELEVQHPAAKLLATAAHAQSQEVGDGANLVLTLGGELLSAAVPALLDGLHPVEIADGYAAAGARALELLEACVLRQEKEKGVEEEERGAGADAAASSIALWDPRDVADTARRISASIGSKQSGAEGVLAPLVAEACAAVLAPQAPASSFSVDDVRVLKLPGGSLQDATVARGLVLRRSPEGVVERVENAKVAVFATGVDTTATETKGTVLLHSAKELENYSAGEERKVEEAIKALADLGVTAVFSGGPVGEIAQHFLDRFGILVVRVPSKFDLRRICRATGATALLKLVPGPTAKDLGAAATVGVRAVGGTRCVVVEPPAGAGRLATVVLRGATQQTLDDLERAVDDGINAFRALGRDPRLLPGGGAPEAELARGLRADARAREGLDQTAFAAYADALDAVPRALAENSGLDAEDALAALTAAHSKGHATYGLDLDDGEPKDLVTLDPAAPVYDLYAAKWWAIRHATDVACTVLRIDQIIMAKAAGGPKPRAPGAGSDAF